MLRELVEAVEVPDVIEPATGWRSWAVRNGRFVSPQQGSAWGVAGELSWDMHCRCGENSPEAIERRRQAQQRQRPMLSWTQRPSTRPGVPFRVTTILGPVMLTPATRGYRYSATMTWGSQVAPDALRMNDECLCGINAFANRHRLALSRFMLPFCGAQAVGEVALWGHARQYRHGWRAEHARVQRVWARRRRDQDAVRAAAQRAGAVYMGVAPRVRWALHAIVRLLRRPTS